MTSQCDWIVSDSSERGRSNLLRRAQPRGRVRDQPLQLGYVTALSGGTAICYDEQTARRNS